MTARFTIRSITCFLVILSLSTPSLAIAATAADRNRATEFRDLAAPHSAILGTGLGARHDRARQRPSAPSLFTLVPLDRGVADPGRLGSVIERRLPHSSWTAGPWTGRSPPAIS